MITLEVVKTDNQINDFIELPFKLYKNSKYWVPPIKKDYKKYILGETTSVKSDGEYIMAICKKNEDTVGRILVGINRNVNDYHGVKDAYFSQYECIDDEQVSNKLFDFAKNWAKERGMTILKGPMSLPGGDDNRGFLLDNFDDAPTVQNVYNPYYYNTQIENFGFEKYRDCYAFTVNPKAEMLEKYDKIIEYAQKKFKYRLDKIRLDKNGLKEDAKDIKQIIDEGMPKTEEWVDFMPPTWDEIEQITNAIKPFADPDFIYIARNNENRPIAFNIAMPDYNQVLKRLNGKINLINLFKFLYYRRKIDRLRVFVLFVIPEYRNKGVTQAMYFKGLQYAIKKNYQEVEGSTIWDHNTAMINDILSAGAKKNKTYRVYQIKL